MRYYQVSRGNIENIQHCLVQLSDGWQCSKRRHSHGLCKYHLAYVSRGNVVRIPKETQHTNQDVYVIDSDSLPTMLAF